MRNLLALLLASTAAATVGPQINGNQINPKTAISISTLTVTGSQGLIVKTTATIQGNAFSVGGSTLIVSGGKVGMVGAGSPLVEGVEIGSNLHVGSQSSGQAVIRSAIGSPTTPNYGFWAVTGDGMYDISSAWIGFATGGVLEEAVGPSSIVVVGTETVKGSAFSVGGSSFTVSGGSATAAYQMTATVFNGAGTSLTGTASGLTAGNVTTNANLTGDVTSSGNATTNVKASGAFTVVSSETVQGALLVNATTPDASTGKLEVHGNIRLQGPSTDLAVTTVTYGNNGATDALNFSPRNATTSHIRFDANGRIGIGTDNPAQPLTVIGTSSTTSSTGFSVVQNSGLGPNGNGPRGGNITNGGESSPLYLGTFGASLFPSISISTANANSMGFVGVHTAFPATPLDVNGSVTLEAGTTGAVLCLTSTHVIGHCTASASCLTTCTCTCTAN